MFTTMQTTTMAPIDNLLPVSLEELNTAAELLKRVDRKYLLDVRAATRLLGELPDSARALEIGGRREFGYASTYLDTDDLTFFSQTAHKRRNRMKVRTRTYLDAGATWLEVKTRELGFTVKDRIMHPLFASDLTEEGVELVAAKARQGGLHPAQAVNLKPVLETDYRRSTILLGDSRMTIDTNLAWRSRVNGHRLSPADWVIVETKGGLRPSAIDRRLWHLGHRPTRVSKYATGMAALHDGLSRNRWHRALSAL